MDIRERVEQVISQHGLTKKEVCDRMGKFDQAFKSLMTNPKWSTLEMVTEAIGIEPWQLFAEEIEAAGYRMVAAPQPEPAAVAKESAQEAAREQQQEPSGEQQQPSGQSAGDELPFKDDEPTEKQEPQQAEEARILRFGYQCPHCGHQVTVTIE